MLTTETTMEDSIIKFMLGFAILLIAIIIGIGLYHIEDTWPILTFVFASWLIGHAISKMMMPTERPKSGMTIPPETANKTQTPLNENPFHMNPYLRHTINSQQQYTSPYQQRSPVREGSRQSDNGLENLILGGAIGYAIGNSNSHRSSGESDSCSSSSSYGSSSYDSGSSSSDSSSSGDD